MKAIGAAAFISLATICASYSGIHAQQPLFIAQEAPGPESLTVWDGVFTQKQADRGKDLYTTHCSECHLATLAGSDMTPPLVGGDFLSNWTGSTLNDLFERIRKTMPMNNPGSVPRDAIPGILAYILSVNKFPTGETELSRDAQQLKKIRIEATKPDQSNKANKLTRGAFSSNHSRELFVYPPGNF
jgi:mono/diheme cytochrome c family protein